MSEATTARSLFHKSRRPFLLRKLHSLTGALPVGGFLLFHLWTNAKALQGQARFDDAVADIHHIPYLRVVEVATILLPLAFHALYGVKLMFEARHNAGKYPYARNWMFTMQRLTGGIAFLFLGLHLAQYWWPKLMGKMTPDEFYPHLCASLSSTTGGVPLMALAYILGIAACVFHFANGLWGFCFSWGITVSRRAQATAATAFGLIGMAVFVLGANTAIYFATGEALLYPASAGAQTCADVAAAPAAPAAGQAH